MNILVINNNKNHFCLKMIKLLNSLLKKEFVCMNQVHEVEHLLRIFHEDNNKLG